MPEKCTSYSIDYTFIVMSRTQLHDGNNVTSTYKKFLYTLKEKIRKIKECK